MAIMRVVHNKENPYFQLNRTCVNDTRLSFKAVGILTYLLSKPDNWVVQEEDLISRHTDGRDAVRSGMKELRDFGYLKKAMVRDASGKVIQWETHVVESPEDDDGDLPEDSQNTRIRETRILANIEKNDLIVKNENTVPKPPPDGVRPGPMFTFSETEETEYREPSKIRRLVDALYSALAQKNKIMKKPLLSKWEATVRNFMMTSDFTLEEFEIEIFWYVKSIGKPFVPAAYSAQAFCDKFVQIRDARLREREENPGAGSTYNTKPSMKITKPPVMTPEEMNEWLLDR